MIRPREGHDLQVERFRLNIFPAHELRWIHDFHGNSIAVADFKEPGSELRILVDMDVEQFTENPFNFILSHYAVKYPFQYESNELAILAPYCATRPSDGVSPEWVSSFWKPGQEIPSLDLLTSINQKIHSDFHYARRDEEGVQTPADTLRRKSGSCRDFALLFIETCRALGLAARFVSGYVYSPTQAAYADASTHAWAEVYLPGAGWKGFDPTAGILACDWHVPTAVSALAEMATPVSGTYGGIPSDYLGMTVSVHVRPIENGKDAS